MNGNLTLVKKKQKIDMQKNDSTALQNSTGDSVLDITFNRNEADGGIIIISEITAYKIKHENTIPAAKMGHEAFFLISAIFIH